MDYDFKKYPLPWSVGHEKMNHRRYAVDSNNKIVISIDTYYVDGIVVDAIVEAVNKQFPMKPIIESREPARCPICSNELSEHKGDGYYRHIHMAVCNECSQKLDWGD